jgi:hypothetical protein
MRFYLVEKCAVLVVALRRPVHGGREDSLLAVGGSIRQDIVNIPGIIRLNDGPSCILLSQEATRVRALKHMLRALYPSSNGLLGPRRGISVNEDR